MLAITDADRSLAAELGLYLVQLPETDDDRVKAADPRATRAPENWQVKSVLDHRPIGRIHFTPVDCLYATKYAAGISGIEETVADALRWLAPLIRHVRTGQYDGVEVIVPRFGSMRERPRALTECGGKATGADYSPTGARIELTDGQAREMCPACRKILEGRGIHDLSHLSERSRSSTVRQRSYIRRLLDEGACSGRPYLLEARKIDDMSNREASATIDRLLALKTRGWKGDL